MARVTDDASELLDLLDEAGLPTGETKRRAEVHRDGDWHRSLQLWIVSGGRSVLLQRRARAKGLEPRKVDASVAGHVRAGEALPQALREAEEEIGVTVRPGELHFLGTWRSVRRYAEAVDREHQDHYALRLEHPLDAYALDCREVEVLYEAPLAGLLELVRGERSSLPVPGFDCQRRVNNALLVEEDLIAQARGVTAEVLERIAAWLTPPSGAGVPDADGGATD